MTLEKSPTIGCSVFGVYLFWNPFDKTDCVDALCFRELARHYANLST